MAEYDHPDFKAYEQRYVLGNEKIGSSFFLSRWFFCWMTPRMKIAKKFSFTQQMHSRLMADDSAKDSYSRVKRSWDTEAVKVKKPLEETSGSHLLWAVFAAFRFQLLGAWFLGILSSLSDYASTYVVYWCLGLFKNYKIDENNPNQIYYDTATVVGLIALTGIISTTIDAYQNFKLSVIGSRMSSGVKCLIYAKMLKKSTEREKLFTLGEITNLMQVDAVNFEAFGDNTGLAFILPFEIIGGFVGLYLIMDWAILPATGVVIFTVLINLLISSMYKAMKKAFMGAKDSRAKLMIELFENIRFVKLAGLESRYITKGLEKKETEITFLKGLLRRDLYSSLLNEFTPVLFVMSMNAFYLWMHGSLSVQKVFTSILILNIFKRNLKVIPDLMAFAVDLTVSSRRISYYLFSEEIDYSFIEFQDQNNPKFKGSAERFSVILERANFYWKDADRLSNLIQIKEKAFKVHKKKGKSIKNSAEGPAEEKGGQKSTKPYSDKQQVEIRSNVSTVNAASFGEPLLETKEDYTDIDLKGISLTIKRNSKIAIVGKTGSGKSTLLNSLLGELYHAQGTAVQRDRKIAYTSQQPWIMTGSLKDNILLGRPFVAERFELAVQGSGMKTDLQNMRDGEDTVVGNKGVGLSGGQRTRLTIARALYAHADLYLFDDPISALDVNVGREVMEKGILGQLKDKTVIVVTHAEAFLPYFDTILVMENGEIVFQGTYAAYSKSEYYSRKIGSSPDNLAINQPQTNRKGSLMDGIQVVQDKLIEPDETSGGEKDRKISSWEPPQQHLALGSETLDEDENRHPSHIVHISHEGIDNMVQEGEENKHQQLHGTDLSGQSSQKLRNKKLVQKSKERPLSITERELIVKKFISAEDKEVGTVGWPVISQYIKSNGAWRIILVIISSLFSPSYDLLGYFLVHLHLVYQILE